MCVIVAYKMPTGKGESSWVLGKNRDRNYTPTVDFIKKKTGGTEFHVFNDKDTHWCEGINSRGLSIVNASLMVIDDEKAISKGKGKKGKAPAFSHDGEIFQEALKLMSVRQAVDHIVKNDVMGFTFVSDGDELYVIEAARERKQFTGDRDKSATKIKLKTPNPGDGENSEIVKYSCQWFKAPSELSQKSFFVRTNHGDYFDDTGYHVGTEDGDSTRNRKISVEKALVRTSPKDINELIDCMSVQPNKNPNHNPVRLKDKCDLFTTGQYIMIPHKKEFHYKPLECKVTINGKPMGKGVDGIGDETNIYVVKKGQEFQVTERFSSFYNK